jgi:hypothetical protein
MRYCLSSSIGRIPSRSSRSNKLTPSPPSDASRLTTVGGSCRASPTSTPLSAFVSGINAAGSVHCVASSTHATRNVNPSKRSSPAPTHVAQTTSARDSTSALAAFSSAKACLRAAVPREERSPRAASRSAAAFFPGVVSAACEGVRGRVRWS